MSRSEQMGKIRERLIKKRDEVFEAHRLGAGLEHFIDDRVLFGELRKFRIVDLIHILVVRIKPRDADRRRHGRVET